MKIPNRATLVSKSWVKSLGAEVREDIMVMMMVMREQTGGRSARSGH